MPKAARTETTIAPTARGRLPRGASSLPRAVVEVEQRKRLVLACASAVAHKGYAQASVADIIAAAGVSRATFYELFSDKEACFLHGFHKLSRAHLKVLEAELAGDDPLPERLHGAIAAYLRRIDVDRTLARAFIAEAEGATARSRSAFGRVQSRLQQVLRGWLGQVRRQYPGIPTRGDAALSLVLAGLSSHVIAKVRRGEGFSTEDGRDILRFVFAGLGLYAWARQVDAGRPMGGHPSDRRK